MSSSDDPFLNTVASYEKGASIFAERTQDRGALAHLHARFAELLPSGATVLDEGCGPGHDGAELADRGLVVVSFDPARRLLREAQAYSSLRGRLILGDARALPFAAARFDGIWACASLLHITKAEIASTLAEASRILKAGGVLLTSMQEGVADGLVPVSPADPLPDRHYSYYRAEEWLALVEKAGFELIEQRLKRASEHVSPGATGWIETFARKP